MDFYSVCAAPVALSAGENTPLAPVAGNQTLLVQRLGLVPYVPTWDLQEQLLAETLAIKAANRQAEASGQLSQPTPNHVIFCQHPPTYTLGKSGKPEHLLLDEAALSDIERVRSLIDDLENKQSVAELLDQAREADATRIFIGSENRLFALSGSSVIAAPYRDREGRVVGVLGVIGPTRLNYARVVPMVDFTARSLGKRIG